MEGTRISNTRRHTNHFGLMTLGGSRDGCNGTRHIEIKHFGWNQKLTKYVRDGQPEKAMQLF
jgi:hypothetical protein